jgi:uncharacterized membrane protein
MKKLNPIILLFVTALGVYVGLNLNKDLSKRDFLELN